MTNSRAVVDCRGRIAGQSSRRRVGGGRGTRPRLPVTLVHCSPRLLQEGDVPRDQRSRWSRCCACVDRAAHAPEVRTTFADRAQGLESAIDRRGGGTRGQPGRRCARPPGLGGLLLGSVSQYAVRHAAGTVVVVRRHADLAATRTVVGFDESPGAQRAHGLGDEPERRSGEDVTALRSWRAAALSGPANVLPLPEDAGLVAGAGAARLEADLEPWREKYPGVRLLVRQFRVIRDTCWRWRPSTRRCWWSGPADAGP